MVVAPIPSRESARLDALHRSRILDTPADPVFDELARLAAYVCRTPMAVISFVDATRQWFKSVVGLPYAGSPRSQAFCAHTILGTDLFIVEDAGADERFADHPWVVGPPSIRLYAGVPLMTPDGHAIGSLAVMDVAPRTLSPEQRACLRTIANQVMAQLALRRSPRPDIRPEQVRRNETEDPALSEDITVRRRTEEALDHWEQVFEKAEFGLACVAASSNVLIAVNPAFARQRGYTVEELIGQPVTVLYPPDLHESVMARILLIDQLGHMVFEAVHQCKDGRPLPVLVAITVITDDCGRPLSRVVSAIDLSERKQVELQARVSEAKLLLALQASNTGLWSWNVDTGEVRFSKEWKGQLGFGESELPDSFETWASLLHPDDRDRAIRYAQRYRTHSDQMFRQDFRLRHKDGSYRWIDSCASFLPEADGRKIRLLGSHTDITGRKGVEQALADSEARFALAVAGANDALWDVRIEPGESWRSPHLSMWWSPHIRSILGLAESEPFDRVMHWADRLHPDDRACVLDLLTAHIEGRLPYDAEYRLRNARDEYRWIHSRGQAIWDEQGLPRRMSGSCQDVTERKRRELLIDAENNALSAIATSTPLPAILAVLCRSIEACVTESLCSVLFLDHDGIHLRYGAGPGLPGAYAQAIEGMTIPADRGLYGTAVAMKQRIIRSDIATDPCWENCRELLLSHGLRVCWFMPIISATGVALGAVALYCRGPRHLDVVDLEALGRAGRMASIAIERARMEDKLQLTQFSIDHAVDALYWIDREACIVDVNQAACAMLGYSAEEFRRMTVQDINPHFPVESWPWFWNETKRAGTASIESVHRAKDGRMIPIEVNVQFLEYQGREYHCAFVRDITERKRIDNLLRINEERFRLVAEATNDILRDWDLATGAHWWSPNAYEKFGVAPDAASDVRAWSERIHSDDRDRVLAMVDQVRRSELTSFSEKYRFRMADGSYGHFYDRGHIVRDASGQARRIIGAMIDVTFSTRAYGSLETAYQRLQRMSRELQTVESRERRRLSRELHDEIGQLLAALKFDLEAIRQALSKSPAGIVESAQERTRRALETTDELFARLRRIVRALRPTVLDELGLKEAIEALVSDIRTRTDLICSVSIEGEGLISSADAALEAAVYRMAQELITNVGRHAQAMTMAVVLTADSHYWVLTVQDDGVGFDPEIGGMGGMGIRGIRERAELLSGQVSIHSTPGAGCTVTVCIPVSAGSPMSGDWAGREIA